MSQHRVMDLIIDIDPESTFHDSRSLESTYGNDLDE